MQERQTEEFFPLRWTHGAPGTPRQFSFYCPVCGKSRLKVIGFRKRFVFVICRNCKTKLFV